MIPYLLAAVGGYLIGDSMKKQTLPDNAILAKGGKANDIDGYVVYFGVYRAGTLTPVIVKYFNEKAEAEEYVAKQKEKGQKGFKVKELAKAPIYSEVRMDRDTTEYKKVKEYLHSKEKIDEFFKNKDSFYKRNYSWVKPDGYEWDNWELVKK